MPAVRRAASATTPLAGAVWGPARSARRHDISVASSASRSKTVAPTPAGARGRGRRSPPLKCIESIKIGVFKLPALQLRLRNE